MPCIASSELVLLPALCLRGRPLGVGMPDLSIDMRRPTGVAELLPSLRPSGSSRMAPDKDTE
jgi:hypothetical protein